MPFRVMDGKLYNWLVICCAVVIWVAQEFEGLIKALVGSTYCGSMYS